jgi:hypothetical protein
MNFNVPETLGMEPSQYGATLKEARSSWDKPVSRILDVHEDLAHQSTRTPNLPSTCRNQRIAGAAMFSFAATEGFYDFTNNAAHLPPLAYTALGISGIALSTIAYKRDGNVLKRKQVQLDAEHQAAHMDQTFSIVEYGEYDFVKSSFLLMFDRAMEPLEHPRNFYTPQRVLDRFTREFDELLDACTSPECNLMEVHRALIEVADMVRTTTGALRTLADRIERSTMPTPIESRLARHALTTNNTLNETLGKIFQIANQIDNGLRSGNRPTITRQGCELYR